MATSFTLDLDVTAPTATVGDPYRIGGNVVVPYTVDEAGVILATVLGGAASILPTLLVTTNPYESGGLVTVDLVTLDDVGNTRPQSFVKYIAPLGGAVGEAFVGGHPVGTATTHGHVRDKSEVSGNPSASAWASGHRNDQADVHGHPVDVVGSGGIS